METDNKKNVFDDLDLGNSGSCSSSLGLCSIGNGEFLATSENENKIFRSEHGATAWLAIRGLNENGELLSESDVNNPFVNEEHDRKMVQKRHSLQSKSNRKTNESEAIHGHTSKELARIPLGQPILAGHHSEKNIEQR